MKNKLIIAAAGSGKTRKLIESALEIKNQTILITTFTEANEKEIIKKIIEEIGYIPENMTIITWFSFLMKHGVKPYQGVMCGGDVNGLLLVNKMSGVKNYYNGRPIQYSEDKEFEKHYFTSNRRIYSDKLSKFVVRANIKSNGRVISRIGKIYQNVFIDEAQDLAGYDLEIVKLFAQSNVKFMLVGDPRQTVYLTHQPKKYPKYKYGKLKEFVENECKKLEFFIDLSSLSHSYRCRQEICDFSNRLYPGYSACNSNQNESTDHDGVYLIRPEYCAEYIEKYEPVQLVLNKSVELLSQLTERWNFGKSKGLTFKRVIIYPTKDMVSWIKNSKTTLKDVTRAQFYVALTRAQFSVGIVFNHKVDLKIQGANFYKPEDENYTKSKSR